MSIAHSAAARTQIEVEVDNNQLILLLGLIAEAKVNIIASTQYRRCFTFVVGEADPSSKENEPSLRKTLQILDKMDLKGSLGTIIQVTSSSSAPGTLYNIQSMIEEVTPVIRKYTGDSDTRWFQVENEKIGAVLKHFNRNRGCNEKACSTL